MQIVVPMSGFGERFRLAGYLVPKPLIEIDGKPIIAHVVDLFPGERDFIFICNRDHLAEPTYRMREILLQACPTAKIIEIEPHKLGPVHAVQQVENVLDLSRPVIVNYCDFACYWNWDHFKWFVAECQCEGAIPAYKGFHPHSLGNTNYAYMREVNGWVQEIQEKQSYTDNRMQEFASSGTYYFASAKIMRDAFIATVESNMQVQGEYYVSLSYMPMLTNGASVAVYPLQHFMQWGTPEDVREYNYWSDAFIRLADSERCRSLHEGSVIVPMAGLGQRFSCEGYSVPKPLISVSGKSMVVQATHDLPLAKNYIFVIRVDMPGFEIVAAELRHTYADCIIEAVDHLTAGQACTALIGLDALERVAGEQKGPITIGACDNGMLYDTAAYDRLIQTTDADVVVWAIRGYSNAIRHPMMYGWIKTNGCTIESVSVKTPLADPMTDLVVVGAFTFLRSSDFRRSVARLIKRDGRINGEFYIDACVNDALALGLKCVVFEIDSYLCWGTPNDLRTFQYWQSCFHKLEGHPYRLELDDRIPKTEIEPLEHEFRNLTPDLPGART